VRDPEVPPEPDEFRIAPKYPDKSTSSAKPVTRAALDLIAGVYENLPDGFTVHPRVAPQLRRRVAVIKNGPVDWATAELLAFGSLLLEHHPVRLVGQDSRRGTFSQRFGAIVDRVTNEAWVPLKHLSMDQAPFDIYDSPLTEFGGLGFEYGYSLAAPHSLVCWEAQYGDFANGAQVIIDEFIMSSGTKWGQESGVVLLLPHGFEGAGPDHSSARPERFLASCQGENITLAWPSTPASYFHLLRTHTLAGRHRPLVVLTPKSMLRNRLSTSTRVDLMKEVWRPVLPDPTIENFDNVRRVLLCSGKIRWDLVEQRASRGLGDAVAIVSLEQLYPIPDVAEALTPLCHVDDIVWVQEEPENQGAWSFLRANLGFELRCVGRPASETAAVGSSTIHAAQAAELVEQAFEGL